MNSVNFENELHSFFDRKKTKFPAILSEAMEYALFGNGKRVRPTLCFLTAEFVEINPEDVIDIAISIECIHTYSLIHDDLPCMDNDDFRRGKPTVHKVYGEAVALLVGDALLNLAYELMLEKSVTSPEYAPSFKLIAENAGASGMIAGQVLEFITEKPGEDDLIDISLKKTAALISASVVSVALLSMDAQKINALSTFSRAVGLGFQLADDLIDLNKKDEKSYVNIFGIEKTKLLLAKTVETAKKSLSKWDKNNKKLLDYCLNLSKRTK